MDALTEEVRQLKSRMESLELLVINLSNQLQVTNNPPPPAIMATTTTTVIESTPALGINVFQATKLPIFGNHNYKMIAELHIEEDISCLTLSNNSNHLTTGLNNGEIVVFDLIKLKKISEHQVNNNLPVICLQYNRDDSILCACSDKIISIFTCCTGKPYEHLKNILIHDKIVNSITFTHELNTFISVSHDNYMKIYNIHDNNCIHSNTSTNIITDVQYNYTNNTYLTVANNIKIFNYKNFQLIKSIENQDEIFYTASFNSSGTKIVSSGILTGDIKVWNCNNYDLIYTFSLKQTSCVPISFSKFNDQYIYFCKDSNSISFIDTTTNRIVQNIDNIEEINNIYNSECFITYATVDQKIKVYSIM